MQNDFPLIRLQLYQAHEYEWMERMVTQKPQQKKTSTAA